MKAPAWSGDARLCRLQQNLRFFRFAAGVTTQNNCSKPKKVPQKQIKRGKKTRTTYFWANLKHKVNHTHRVWTAGRLTQAPGRGGTIPQSHADSRDQPRLKSCSSLSSQNQPHNHFLSGCFKIKRLPLPYVAIFVNNNKIFQNLLTASFFNRILFLFWIN